MALGELELRLAAIERFFQSTRQAERREYWARFTRKSYSLLKYEEVAARLHLRQQIPIGHQMVLLDHIVGSVGRYREFTQGFYPRASVMQDRWVAVDVALNSLRGLPPVELYKVGEANFAVDGNHRISVARANGNKDIEATVVEWQTPIPFTVADFTADAWLLKAAYADFLLATKLDELRPGAVLSVSNPDYYQTLLQHIAVHRYLANQPHHLEMTGAVAHALSWEEAVTSWYDTIYLPLVEAMRARKLPARFPQQTETDLYVAITHDRERIAERYELAPLNAATAVAVFAANHSGRWLDAVRLAVRQQIADLSHVLPWHGRTSSIPAGMSPTEFAALRLRHDAGELGLIEATRKYAPDTRLIDTHREPSLSVQFSG